MNVIQSIENQLKILEKSISRDFKKAIPGHGKSTDKKHEFYSRQHLGNLILQ